MTLLISGGSRLPELSIKSFLYVHTYLSMTYEESGYQVDES